MVFIDQLIDDMRVSENEAIILWDIYIYTHNGHIMGITNNLLRI